jgi:hypothetical protein
MWAALRRAASHGSSPAHRRPRNGSRRQHLTAVQHLAFLPMQSPTPYGSARMICLVSASMAQVMQLVVTSRASIFRREGKLSAQFPGKTNLCNDMTVASDGTIYVTNSLMPQILQLKPGGALEVWVWSFLTKISRRSRLTCGPWATRARKSSRVFVGA